MCRYVSPDSRDMLCVRYERGEKREKREKREDRGESRYELCLSSEICKSNYKNHSAEIFTRQMQRGIVPPAPCPSLLPLHSFPAGPQLLLVKFQTQSNRPANCQTSNDEIKSNRKSSRSRNGNRTSSGNRSWPTSLYPPPVHNHVPYPCLTSD